MLEDEIDFLPTEAGTKDEKNTISDSIFRVDISKGIKELRLRALDREITVNFEMQTSTSESALKYNIISRAIYYGASLLRDTVPAGDTKYTNLHKVYTVWFCKDNIKLDKYNDIGDRYIHRYGIRRFYDDITDHVVKTEKESDLIEAVMVELPKLKNHIDSLNDEMVYKLFFDTTNVVTMIEHTAKVNLTKVRKGVNNMIDYEARLAARLAESRIDYEARLEARLAESRIDYEARTKARVAEALNEGEAKGEAKGKLKGEVNTAKSLIDNLHKKNEQIAYNKLIKEAETLLNLSSEAIEELNKIYK